MAEGLEALDALGGILAFLKSGANLDFRREGLGTNENRDQGWRGWVRRMGRGAKDLD